MLKKGGQGRDAYPRNNLYRGGAYSACNRTMAQSSQPVAPETSPGGRTPAQKCGCPQDQAKIDYGNFGRNALRAIIRQGNRAKESIVG